MVMEHHTVVMTYSVVGVDSQVEGHSVCYYSNPSGLRLMRDAHDLHTPKRLNEERI